MWQRLEDYETTPTMNINRTIHAVAIPSGFCASLWTVQSRYNDQGKTLNVLPITLERETVHLLQTRHPSIRKY